MTLIFSSTTGIRLAKLSHKPYKRYVFADTEVCIQINILSNIYAFINTYMLNYAVQFIVFAQYQAAFDDYNYFTTKN